jgi:predicted nucleotidyltransferase component of viral defense system
LDIKLEFVEKDYWISLVLSRLAKSAYVDACVFKGGTSLSKGYRLLDRLYVLPAEVGLCEKKIRRGGWGRSPARQARFSS